jgi:hypothetical protein
MQHEHFRSNTLARQSSPLQQAVHADDAADLSSAAREIEHAHSAEAETQRRDTLGIYLSKPPRRRQGCKNSAPKQRSIFDERAHERAAFFQRLSAAILAVHIQSERGESELRERFCFALDEPFPSARHVTDQYSRERSWPRLIECEKPSAQGLAVSVSDFLRADHGYSPECALGE